MRKAEVRRKTTETEIELALCVDGTGIYNIDAGCGFLNHMLELFAKHAAFDLSIKAKGDIEVDDHHTVEDVAIVLGQALRQALGNKAGIYRYGDIVLPMDEALVLCAIDLGGRGVLGYALDFPSEKIGTFDTELVQEFFFALVREAGVTLHLRQYAGANSHHIAEAAFKGFARALAQAAAINPQNPNDVPSTKGTIQ